MSSRKPDGSLNIWAAALVQRWSDAARADPSDKSRGPIKRADSPTTSQEAVLFGGQSEPSWAAANSP